MTWGRELIEAALLAGLRRPGVVVSRVDGFPDDREVILTHAEGRVSARAGSLDEARELLLARPRAGEQGERTLDRAGRRGLALVREGGR